MAEAPIHHDEPGQKPALPSAADMDRNLFEWRAEVERRVRILVLDTLRHNRHPNENAMRSLGPGGRKLYQDSLRKAVDRDVSVNAATPQIASPDERSNPSRQPGRQLPAPVAQLHAAVHWRDRQNERLSYTDRALASGIKLAAVLIAAAVLFLNADLIRALFIYIRDT